MTPKQRLLLNTLVDTLTDMFNEANNDEQFNEWMAAHVPLSASLEDVIADILDGGFDNA